MENNKQKNMPEFQTKSGKISVAVWKNISNKNGKDTEYKTVSLSESYKKGEEWQHKSISVSAFEVPRLLVLLQEVQKHLVIRGETAQ